MQLEHSFTVPVPVEAAWQVLLDLPRVAPCMPGATLTGVEGDTFTGNVKVKLGPIALTYQGKGRFLERDEDAHRVVIEASGKDTRSAGTAAATVSAALAPEGDTTRVDVVTDLKVTGRPAQFGRSMIADVSGKLIGMFADCLARTLAEPAAEPATASAAETVRTAGAGGEPEAGAGSGSEAGAGSGSGAAARVGSGTPAGVGSEDGAGGGTRVGSEIPADVGPEARAGGGARATTRGDSEVTSGVGSASVAAGIRSGDGVSEEETQQPDPPPGGPAPAGPGAAGLTPGEGSTSTERRTAPTPSPAGQPATAEQSTTPVQSTAQETIPSSAAGGTVAGPKPFVPEPGAEAEPIDLLKLTGSTDTARRIARYGLAALVLAVLGWLVIRWLRD